MCRSFINVGLARLTGPSAAAELLPRLKPLRRRHSYAASEISNQACGLPNGYRTAMGPGVI